MEITKLVERKIADEADVANEIAARMQPGAADIHDFFCDALAHEDDPQAYTKSTTNLPDGVKLSWYLLMSDPVVVDLRPVAPREFESVYGVDSGTLSNLAEGGEVRLNLYFRNPADWHGYGHMLGLVSRSVANGERVNAFMRTVNPGFLDDVERYRLVISRLVSQADRATLAAAMRAASKPEDLDATVLTPIMSHQWAYLNTLAPESAVEAQLMADEGRLRDLALHLRISKHLHASRYSAALGGRFVWGTSSPGLKTIRRTSPASIRKHQIWRSLSTERRAALEFLLSTLGQVRRPMLPRLVDPSGLLRFLRNKDTRALRRHLWECVDTLADAAGSGDDSTMAAQVGALSTVVDRWEQRCRIAQATTGGVGLATAGAAGHFVGGAIGMMFGGGLGIALGAALSTQREALGRKLCDILFGDSGWGPSQRAVSVVRQLRE